MRLKRKEKVVFVKKKSLVHVQLPKWKSHSFFMAFVFRD